MGTGSDVQMAEVMTVVHEWWCVSGEGVEVYMYVCM